MRNVKTATVIIFGLSFCTSSYALFGAEMVPLMKLVGWQVVEIEKLAQILHASKDQVDAIRALNEGIKKTVEQIESLEVIIDRAQGVDPTAIRSLSDLNDFLERVQSVKQYVDDMMEIRIKAASIAIAQSAVQSDTSYKMGQEMIGTGTQLARESRGASPGRAAQITAAANSADMVAKGVELQNMSQLVQLQAVSLDLQRAQIEKEMVQRKASHGLFMSTLKQNANTKAKQ